MRNYNRFNNIIGWLVFAIASSVYIMTSEPTVSLWDCGEYIATAFKLQVGHPPGAPTFQILGRIFSLFAGNDLSQVAHMVNMMSALASGFTILFLFWSITMLAKKVIGFDEKEKSLGSMLAIFGAGIVGAMAYTFSDSFWFSAVEGEVYASSSFCTAIVFWAMLKWDEVAFEKYANRWIVLIAYIIGLSIGVHLLNLLTIPAIAYIYYFRMYKTSTTKGLILTGLISFIILALVMYFIIPWTVNLFGKFEIMFVNGIGLPFNSGTLFFAAILIGGIFFGLHYTRKKAKPLANLIILSFMFLLIGYTTFLMLIIRSNANTPINENSPKDAVSLLSYLNREQYGSNPLIYGQYYNAPVIAYEDGNPVYTHDEKSGKYIITDERKGTIPKYDPRFCTIFPRMWSNSENEYMNQYKVWANIEGTPITVQGRNGDETINKPTFGENLKFFFKYQMGHMYFRYFMWNFAGRQSDIQHRGGITNGNWISGINFIDEARLGPQDNLPDSLKNKGRNKFYFLPLLLGLIGLAFQIKKDSKSALVVGFLFFMTGIAIGIYLNMYAYQPRERDYAFAGSFYAFAIWIGFGVIAIYDFLKNKIPSHYAAIATTLGCLLLVPTIMAKDGWDDHDRSGRYAALTGAENYLNSCAKNAILFTNGDNDTFPLWYAQEVEGIRTDVRVVNLSLLNTDWYINQMKRKVYNSDAVPSQLTNEQYRQGTRDFLPVFDQNKKGDFVDLKKIMDFICDDKSQVSVGDGRLMNYFPANKFSIPVDSATVVNNGTVSKQLSNQIVKHVEWTFKGNYIQKNTIMVLDILANNNWKRPIYFAITTGGDAYVGLEEYFQLEGLAYRLVPVKTSNNDGQTGRINSNILYRNLMTKFKFGNMNDPNVYLSDDFIRMVMNFRNIYSRLAHTLINEGNYSKAIKVVDFCLQEMPDETITYNYFALPLAEAYLRAGATEKGKKVLQRMLDLYEQNIKYYFSFTGSNAKLVDDDKQQSIAVMQRIAKVATDYKQTEIASKATSIFQNYYGLYTGQPAGQPNMPE